MQFQLQNVVSVQWNYIQQQIFGFIQVITECMHDRISFGIKTALSQLRICRPPRLSFDLTLMKDMQCAEMNEIFFFSDFYFSIYRENSSKIDNV